MDNSPLRVSSNGDEKLALSGQPLYFTNKSVALYPWIYPEMLIPDALYSDGKSTSRGLLVLYMSRP